MFRARFNSSSSVSHCIFTSGVLHARLFMPLSADACILAMSCVGFSRTRPTTVLSPMKLSNARKIKALLTIHHNFCPHQLSDTWVSSIWDLQWQHKLKGGGRTLTTKWLLWKTSNHLILVSLTSLGLNFGQVCSIEGCCNFLKSRPYFESHMTIILKPLKLKQLTCSSNKNNANG